MSQPIAPQDQRAPDYENNYNYYVPNENHSLSLDSLTRSTRSKNIVILTSELKRNQKSQNVINNALAMLYQGHKVRIIVSEVDRECWEEEINKLSIKIIKSWIPNAVCGLFRNELKIIRTMLLAFWTSTYSSGKQNPVIILTDTCAISMPILKLFGHFKIIYFQYFFQLETLPHQNNLLSIQPTWVQSWSMQFADEVIVQNCASARIFGSTFQCAKPPRVLYPCIDIGPMEREESLNIFKIIHDFRKETNTFFLVTGPFLPRSNFELAIEAFEIVYSKLFKRGERLLPLLVIAGKFSELDKFQRNYYTRLLEYVSNLQCGSNIILLKRFSTVTKKTLLSYCLAVLHTTSNEMFGNQILEAMYMGRPVVACNDGVGVEYLSSDCGILAKPNALSFSSAMYSLLRDKVMCAVLGVEAKKCYTNNFSFNKYSNILNAIVEHITPKERTLSYVECQPGLQDNRMKFSNSTETQM